MTARLVTLGETMGLVVQHGAGHVHNGEPMTLRVGGAESNVAIGVRRLGVSTAWVGRLGSDPLGELIRRELRAEQVQLLAVDDPAPTGMMLRWRPAPGHGQVSYYRRASAGSHLCPDDLPGETIADADVLHGSGITLALGADPAAALHHAIALARDAGTTVSFDVNHRTALWSEEEATRALAEVLSRCDVVFAGLDEARLVGGDVADAAAAAQALEALGPSQVMIKLGPDGCLARIDGVTYRQPAPAVPVIDTVGAGDAFVAGYLAELISGADPARRLATAVTAGALVVGAAGDWEGMPDRAALARLGAPEPVIR